MRGEVLHYDESQGFGFITGADGNRYTFRREDLRRHAPLGKGAAVEFEPSGGQARRVFLIRTQLGNVAANALSSAAPQQFGRNATAWPAATSVDPGLWGYFTRALTSNYANFRERARRKEYWAYVLFWMLAVIALSFGGLTLDLATQNMEGAEGFPAFTMIAVSIWGLATLVPGLAITVRRLHDIGLSGWLYLLILIPYIGGLIILVFSLIPSQKHANKWGPVPAGVVVPPLSGQGAG